MDARVFLVWAMQSLVPLIDLALQGDPFRDLAAHLAMPRNRTTPGRGTEITSVFSESHQPNQVRPSARQAIRPAAPATLGANRGRTSTRTPCPCGRHAQTPVAAWPRAPPTPSSHTALCASPGTAGAVSVYVLAC